MQKYNLLSVIRRKKYRNYGNYIHKYENLLNRNFHADRPNQKWVTDISYIHTKQGVLYLSLIHIWCRIYCHDRQLELRAPERLRPIKMVRTMPYPGFPTDAQAPMMTMATLAKGTSVFVENIFESRYKHVGELLRMGANIKVEGKVAVVEGVQGLYGAQAVSYTHLFGKGWGYEREKRNKPETLYIG